MSQYYPYISYPHSLWCIVYIIFFLLAIVYHIDPHIILHCKNRIIDQFILNFDFIKYYYHFCFISHIL